MIRTIAIATAASASLLSACSTPSSPGAIVRHRVPGSTFPIASVVEIRGGATTYYLSGQVPPNLDATPGAGRPPVYGQDTKTQTVGTLQSIEKTLKGLGLSMGDVVKMQVFLVGDPGKGGRMDFAGFMEGYTQFFGTESQPDLPSRSVFQVVALANPAWFVEIEVVAVRQ